MRYFVLGLVALAFTAPVQARDHDRAPEAEIAEKMNDPVMQDRVAGAMLGVMGAVLDMRIGEIERAIDPSSPTPRDETLRDRAERDDPYFEERMVGRTRAMTGTMGAMATQMAVMMPEFRRMMAEMAGRMADIGSTVSIPDYEDDWDD
ncbi:hypothetical protein [Sphingomonas cavernae]|uniref:LTXXQ motif family protein n=1 Tax=Sphingomonas cavernae TaxID=2320861 RepID=A0A418WRP3_9SPHN|nr:hypothetical protein [Sphingomonas cavernae]RJF93923.1 hypothetical protein D3876_06520 [Sphingomonas cavernae]